MSIEPNFENAVRSLAPDVAFSYDDNNIIDWDVGNKGVSQPTQSEIDAELVKLRAEYDAQEYARNRKAEYPDWGSQLNKIYDDGVTKWKSEMVDPVKAKWPKDNSGPV